MVSLLGVVPKPGSNEFRLVINMRYVNNFLSKRVFKFEGFLDLADIAKRGDHSVPYDLKSGCYHVGILPASGDLLVSNGRVILRVFVPPVGLSTAPWVFSKVMRELVL